MIVKVCDMIMGAGKTQSAITQMNEDTQSRYIFVTPYLDEVKRIRRGCAERGFREPQQLGAGKLDHLHELLTEKKNIACTHALFERYNEETIELIRNGEYKLIMDEAFHAVKVIEISQRDLELLRNKDNGMIEVEAGSYRVNWTKDDYQGKFEELRDMCKMGNVILYRDCLFLWAFPVDVFRAFTDVTILTYLFDAQEQKYYFDTHGIEVKKIGTVCEDGVYRFSEVGVAPEYVKTLHEKIHILDDERLNEIGDKETALSSSWYARAEKEKGKPNIRRLKNNLVNVFTNRYAARTSQTLWTTFKKYHEKLKGNGYTSGFLACNARATNAYRERDHLAYCINIYYHPYLRSYFVEQGVDVHDDEYALSEMIQWIWRSAIRDGKEIWVYIPSRRMRELLKKWLLDLSSVDYNEQNQSNRAAEGGGQ